MLSNEKKNPIKVGPPFPFPPLEDGRVYISCVGNVQAPVVVKLHSKNGNLLYQSAHCLPKHGGTMELHLPDLNPGDYSLHIDCGNYSEKRTIRNPMTGKKSVWEKLNFLTTLKGK